MSELSAGRGTSVPPARFDEAAVPAEPLDNCPRCGHAMVGHDRIAARYCAATVRGDTTRTCICRRGTGAPAR